MRHTREATLRETVGHRLASLPGHYWHLLGRSGKGLKSSAATNVTDYGDFMAGSDFDFTAPLPPELLEIGNKIEPQYRSRDGGREYDVRTIEDDQGRTCILFHPDPIYDFTRFAHDGWREMISPQTLDATVISALRSANADTTAIDYVLARYAARDRGRQVPTKVPNLNRTAYRLSRGYESNEQWLLVTSNGVRIESAERSQHRAERWFLSSAEVEELVQLAEPLMAAAEFIEFAEFVTTQTLPGTAVNYELENPYRRQNSQEYLEAMRAVAADYERYKDESAFREFAAGVLFDLSDPATREELLKAASVSDIKAIQAAFDIDVAGRALGTSELENEEAPQRNSPNQTPGTHGKPTAIPFEPGDGPPSGGPAPTAT